MVQSFLCTPWLQKSISAKIPLLLQVTSEGQLKIHAGGIKKWAQLPPTWSPTIFSTPVVILLFDNLKEKRYVPLTIKPGIECFQMSCSTPFENHCCVLMEWLKTLLRIRWKVTIEF